MKFKKCCQIDYRVKSFLLFINLSFVLSAQNVNKSVYVVFNKQSQPVKVYDKVEDVIRFTDNAPYSHQDVHLQFDKEKDAKYWQLENTQTQVKDLTDPVPLTDAQLAVDSVYIVMQSSLQLADKVFTKGSKIDCDEYAENFRAKVIKVPFLYRDEKSVKAVKANRAKRGIN